MKKVSAKHERDAPRILLVARTGSLPPKGRAGITTGHFFDRPSIRVIIKREGPTKYIRWSLDRLWLSMVREIRCRENHRSVENGQDALHTRLHFAVPQFEPTLIFICPTMIKVDNQIQPPIELIFEVLVEIGVDGELSACTSEMKSTASPIRIRDKSYDPRHPFQSLQEQGLPKTRQKETSVGSILCVVGGSVFVLGVSPIVVVDQVSCFHIGPLVQYTVECSCVEKIVNRKMREWCRARVVGDAGQIEKAFLIERRVEIKRLQCLAHRSVYCHFQKTNGIRKPVVRTTRNRQESLQRMIRLAVEGESSKNGPCLL